MIDQASWQESNARYLSIALAWLRLRLEQHAQQMQAPAAEPPPVSRSEAPSPKHGFLRRLPAEPGGTDAEPTTILATPTRISDERVAQKATEMAEAESQMESPPA